MPGCLVADYAIKPQRPGIKHERPGVSPSAGASRSVVRRAAQYIFGGSVWLRSRLWVRFTAAASLRLRSVVGFS